MSQSFIGSSGKRAIEDVAAHLLSRTGAIAEHGLNSPFEIGTTPNCFFFL